MTSFVRVWDVVTGRQVLQARAPLGRPLFDVSWSPDGSRFVANCYLDGTATVFDATTGKPLITLRGGTTIHRPSWSPDGNWLVAAASPQPLIFDATTGAARLRLEEDLPSVSAEWSPDGNRIAVAYEEGTVKVWDVSTSLESDLTQPSEVLQTFSGHTTGIWDVTWSPDGRQIASADDSGAVKVWDAATGAQILSFAAPNAVYTVDWSPDGSYVLAAGFFNTPPVRRVWPSTEALIAHAKKCCVLRQLTPAEREKFGLPPR